MEQLRLVSPDESMAEEIRAYRQAMLDVGSSMDGTGPLRQTEDPMEWLETVQKMSRPETCPPDWMVATQLVCVRENDGRIVGMIDIRHRLNDHLRLYGGHIGYSVRPDERRKGYAKRMLALALPEAKKRGIDRVLVTCDDDNEGSRRTIEANGGRFERNTYFEDEKSPCHPEWHHKKRNLW